MLAGAQRAVFCAVRVADFLAEGAGWGASPGRGEAQQVLKKNLGDWRRFFLRRPFGLPTSQGRGGLGSMDSTLALGAFRITRGAGGEAVDVNGNLVEREKGD